MSSAPSKVSGASGGHMIHVTKVGEVKIDWTPISASGFSIGIEAYDPERGRVIKCGKSGDINAQDGITQLEWTIQTEDKTQRVVWDLSNVNGDPFNAEGFHATANTSNGGDCRGSVCSTGVVSTNRDLPVSRH